VTTVLAPAADPARPRPALPETDRATLLNTLVGVLEETRADWAFQGAHGAAAEWCGADDAHDLDLWVRDLPPSLAAHLDARGARVADTGDPRRLRHVTWAVLLDAGPALVDVTVGDLRVGAVLLVPAAEVQVADGDLGRVLTGAAAVADLLPGPPWTVRSGPRSRSDSTGSRAAASWSRR
jgi:hypothetical protein